MFYFHIDLPSDKNQLSFAKSWADKVVEKGRIIAPYSDAGLIIRSLHVQLDQSLIKLQTKVRPDSTALGIATARLIDRAMKQPHNFDIKLTIEHLPDNHEAFYIAPGNIASLIFLRGFEHVPKGVKSTISNFETSEASYTYFNARSYKTKRK